MESKCKVCGCDEFITTPNKYDIYKIINGKLEFQRSELIEDEIELFCRDCFKVIEFYSKRN